MKAQTIIGIILIVAGAIGLFYEQFTFTKDTHEAKVGPIELSVKEKETIDIPKWVGGGAILIGVVLLIAGRKS